MMLFTAVLALLYAIVQYHCYHTTLYLACTRCREVPQNVKRLIGQCTRSCATKLLRKKAFMTHKSRASEKDDGEQEGAISLDASVIHCYACMSGTNCLLLRKRVDNQFQHRPSQSQGKRRQAQTKISDTFIINGIEFIT